MRPTKTASLLSAALPVVFAAVPASGQTSDDEVITTGLRQAYQGDFAPLETPAANTTIEEDLLRDVNAVNLADALDLSASVARQNNFGGLWNSFSVRGFSGDINLPSGYLVNGFNAGRGFGGPRDIAGIESVEILKGPRGALFGRGEPGGTVNLVTKRPDFNTGGYVQGTVGSWDQYRGEADLQTFTEGDGGAAGFRLVGFHEDAESFRDEVETEKYGIYPSVTLALGNATLSYELEYTEQELPFDRGVVFSDAFGFSPRDLFVGEPVPIETEALGHQLEAGYDISDDWSFLAGVGYRETSLEGDAFEPQFGSRQTYFRDVEAGGGQTISRFFRSRDFDSDYFVLRGELSGDFDTGPLRHRLIIGADYDRFDNTLRIDRGRPSPRGDFLGDGRLPSEATPAEAGAFLLLDIDDPVYGLNPNPDASVNTRRNEVLEGVGIYVQDQISITDALQVRIGGRYDDFEQDLTDFRNAPSTITASDDRFSPQVGVVYAVNESLSLYGSYGEGYRLQTGQDFQGNQFDPNVTESLEAGFKAELGGFTDAVDGFIGVSLFQVDQSNFLVNDDRPEATAVGFFSIAAGEARSRGVEVDANLKFDFGTSLWASYAYTDAQFENEFADADGFGFTIQPGDPLINSPEHQLNLQASQDFELADLPLQLGAGLLYVGDRNGFVGTDFELPDYTTVRAFAQVGGIEGVSLRLDVDNIFDETFYTNSFADVWVQPGDPRRFRVTARYGF